MEGEILMDTQGSFRALGSVRLLLTKTPPFAKHAHRDRRLALLKLTEIGNV